MARPKLLLAATGRRSSLGSGFLVGDGLAITNYRVVSQSTLEPGAYRLEYVAVDGRSGEAKLLAIDLPSGAGAARQRRRALFHFR